MQIDGLLDKLNNASGDLERLRDEKDQEIMILQAGMDSTIEKLSEVQQVRCLFYFIQAGQLLTSGPEPRSRR